MLTDLICPKCGNPPDGMSEHQYFAFDVLAARCTKCLMYTISGAGRWVQFPKWTGEKRLILGIPPAPTVDEQRQLDEFSLARNMAIFQLGELTQMVHLKKMVARTVKENCEAVAAIPWTKEPETWRDREPLL